MIEFMLRYCDKDGAKVEYRKEDQVCDGFEHCSNGADESKDRCNDNYCEVSLAITMVQTLRIPKNSYSLYVPQRCKL